jgi:hypothetical protein
VIFVDRHEFLRGLHRVTGARNYLEVGVNDGRSLALSRVPSIGIDPAFKVNVTLRGDIHLVKATSDDFFAGRDPLGHLKSARNPFKNMRKGRPLLSHYRGGTSLDLAFIDGLHLFEYALRDFMNVERFSRFGTAIVLDDMLPRDVDEAARDRHTKFWAGDVYKLIPVLAKYRPDLTVLPVDTEPTGVLFILGADPDNTVLKDHYEEICEEWVVPDPQKVPESILSRVDAVKPEAILNGSFWPSLIRARNRRSSRSRGYESLRREVNTALGRS